MTQSTHELTQVFEYEGNGVRVAGTPDEPLFVAADVCRVLGISQTATAMQRIDDDERGVALINTPGGVQEMACVNESGLYSLILGSRKPEAKAFKRWVTHEVLPSIRKTGRYSVNMSPAEHLLAQAQALVEQERRQAALESRTEAIEDRMTTVEARQAQGAPTSSASWRTSTSRVCGSTCGWPPSGAGSPATCRAASAFQLAASRIRDSAWSTPTTSKCWTKWRIA